MLMKDGEAHRVTHYYYSPVSIVCMASIRREGWKRSRRDPTWLGSTSLYQ